jgi:hypothetical protein
MIEQPQGVFDPTELERGPIAGEPTRREGAKWFAGVILVFTLAAFIAALSLFQATSEGTAERAHQRALATLTEIDLVIERNYEALQLQAETAQIGEPVLLAGFPVRVPLMRDEVLGSEPEELRTLLLERGADRLYEDGTAALRDEAEAAGTVGMLSVAGITDRGLGLLRERNHTVFGFATIVLGAATLALAALVVALSRGFGRIGSAGVAMAAAAVPVIIVTGAMHLYARNAGSRDGRFIAKEFAGIVEELTWIPVRNGLAFGMAGALLAIAALVAGRMLERRTAVYREPRAEARAR